MSSKKEFREQGITFCIIAAMRHYSDAQLLCMNHRYASSYLVAIRGVEEVGKAILYKEGHDLKRPGGHMKRLKAFFQSISSFRRIDPDEWADWFVGEANNARYVDIIDLGKSLIWNHPMVRFKNERMVCTLRSGIDHFVSSIFTNEQIEEEYSKLDHTCKNCFHSDPFAPRDPCNRGDPPPGQVLTGSLKLPKR